MPKASKGNMKTSQFSLQTYSKNVKENSSNLNQLYFNKIYKNPIKILANQFHHNHYLFQECNSVSILKMY